MVPPPGSVSGARRGRFRVVLEVRRQWVRWPRGEALPEVSGARRRSIPGGFWKVLRGPPPVKALIACHS